MKGCPHGFNCNFSHEEHFRTDFTREKCTVCKQAPTKEALTKPFRTDVNFEPHNRNQGKVPCHHYFHTAKGCQRRDECTFSHDERFRVVFLQGGCSKCIQPPTNTLPRLGKNSGTYNESRGMKPCHYYFHTKNSCQHGDECKYSHDTSLRASFLPETCENCKQSYIKPQRPQGRNRTPCHFYHLNIPHDNTICTFSHSGQPQGKCTVPKCPRCQPCHFYHLGLKHDDSKCPFRHEGQPTGRCIAKNCSSCKKRTKAPCHFYHLKQKCPFKEKCQFSHFGEAAGECLVNDCPICEEAKAKQALQAQKRSLKKLTLELPRWAIRKFYGLYEKEISGLFQGAQLKTTPNLAILFYPPDIAEKVVDYWNFITERFSDSLEKSSWLYPIPGTSLYGVVRNGLEVTDMLFPGEYYRVDFTFPPNITYDEICQTIGVANEDVEDMRVNSRPEATDVIVKFISKAEALACYEDFSKNPREGIDCKPVCPTSNQKSSLKCSVILRFSVKKSVGTCSLKYSNEMAPGLLRKKLQDQQSIIDGSMVTVRVKNNDVELANLNPFTNEYKIAQIAAFFDEVPQMCLPREENKEDVPYNFLKQNFPSELTKYAHQIMFNAKSIPKQSKKYSDTYKYEIFFRNKKDALAFASNFEGTLFGYPCCTATVRFCVNISFINSVYKMFRDTLENLIPVLKLQDPKYGFQLDPLENELKVGNNQISFYRKFSLEDHEVTPLDLEREFIHTEEMIMDVISENSIVPSFGEAKKIAFSPSMMNYYRELQREPMYENKIYISYNMITQTLMIFSQDQKLREHACKRIVDRATTLKELENTEKIDLNNYRISFMRGYFKRKFANEQLEWTHFDIIKKQLTILTKDPKAKEIITQTLKHCLKGSGKEADEETCGMCLTDEASYRGVGCAHKFCVTCLESGYSETAKETSIFVKCPQQDCGTKICPYDLFETANPEDLQILLRRHVSAYLAAHKNHFVYCGTKGCPNLIKMPSKGHEPEEVTCDSCQKSFCGRSMSELHAPHSKASPCPIDSKLKEELLKDQNNKEMKCCGQLVGKLEGCNKVKCICGKYVCWLCLEFFEDQDDCYSHLIKVHGGFHEVNEIEKIMEQNGAKKLKCCGNLAFKDGGCNKIDCPLCKKSCCWLCLDFFNIPSACYSHLTKVHGGYY